MTDQSPAGAWPQNTPDTPSETPPVPMPPTVDPAAGATDSPPFPAAPSSTGPAAIPAATSTRPDLGRGIVYGLGAAILGAIAWYAITVLSDRQFVYLAVAFGLLVGYAVVKGAGRADISTAVVAVVIAALGILSAYYFIDRHFLIEALNSTGDLYEDVPLFGSFEQVKEILRTGFEVEKSQFVFSLIAIGAAGFMGAKGQ